MPRDLAFTKLMIDTAKGCPEVYSVAQANRAIRKRFAAAMGIEEGASVKEIRRAFRKNKWNVYEIIEDVIDERLQSGWGDNPFFRQFVEVKNLADGDTNEFFVPDDSILTVTKFSGNHHDLTRQKLGMGRSFSVTTDWYGIKVYEEFERFMAGRIDWTELVDKLYEALDKKVNDMLYQSFLGLDDIMPAAYSFAGTVTRDAILDRVEKVQTATGHEVMIAAPRSALAKITALTNASMWSDEMKNQRNSLGELGLWEGVELLRIPQVFAQGTREFVYPENKFYIIPKTDNKPIKLVYEGDGQFWEDTDSATKRDMTIEAEYHTKLGIAVVFGLDFAVGEIE